MKHWGEGQTPRENVRRWRGGMHTCARALNKKTHKGKKNREKKNGRRGRTWRREDGGVAKIKKKRSSLRESA